MSLNNSISDDSYSDDDDEEELDPRIQDELEKLNAATNSINHLEAELDEARAVFRQTLAGATYHLNGIARKLGKCVEKSRPFYEAYRQLRQSHSMLQKSTNQFERATGMHVAAKTRVFEAERRVFGGDSKRAFDSALQEMLNQATIEVNEAEKMKRDSWKKHQEDLQAYRDLESKVKQLYKKLKNSVDKAKPYFEQKKDFDRHLWQLKVRVDSIHIGLGGAKENYSACLKSLEVISDDIHEKRRSKRMDAMIAKLQEREAGVGADSSTEDETSLSASNLDLDFDSNINFDKLEGISDSLSNNVQSWSLSEEPGVSRTDRPVSGCEGDLNVGLPFGNRVVYGLESTKETEEDKLQLSNNDSSSEKSKQNEVTINEDGTDSSLDKETSLNKETPEKELLNMKFKAKDTAQGQGRKEVEEDESVSLEDNDSECKESFEKDEETRTDVCVSAAKDEAVALPIGAAKDDNTIVEEGSSQKVDKVELESSLGIDSEVLENRDDEKSQNECHENVEEESTQDGIINEIDIAKNESEVNVDESDPQAEKDEKGHNFETNVERAEETTKDNVGDTSEGATEQAKKDVDLK